MVLKPGKSKLKVLTDSVPDENPLPGSQRAEFFLYPHMVGLGGGQRETEREMEQESGGRKRESRRETGEGEVAGKHSGLLL